MNRSIHRALTVTLALGLVVGLPLTASAKEPTAAELLSKYDEIMGPHTFDADAEMTAWREDGSTRGYVLRMLRGEGDKFRIWFKEPASVKGQEMLRSGDNLWLYLPNLKRATRVANRDNFQGGDFNNADVLRVNYAQDYDGKLVPSEDDGTWKLELKAKHENTAYERIELWLRKKDSMPVRGRFYGTSGQLLRSAEFSEYTELDKGYVRPARVVMQNELVKSRRSEMRITRMKTKVDAPAQRFTQTDLGR